MEKPELKVTQKRYTGESTVISTRLPKDLVKELDGVADKTGRTRNEILQMSLEFALRHMTIESADKV